MTHTYWLGRERAYRGGSWHNSMRTAELRFWYVAPVMLQSRYRSVRFVRRRV
jgi:hypothetical protein